MALHYKVNWPPLSRCTSNKGAFPLSLLSLCLFSYAAGACKKPKGQKGRRILNDRLLEASLMSLKSLLSLISPRPLARQRKSPERATRIQPGVSAALPPVIKARDSVYRASSARPAMLCGKRVWPINCSPERQVGHLPSSGTPSGMYHEGETQ